MPGVLHRRSLMLRCERLLGDAPTVGLPVAAVVQVLPVERTPLRRFDSEHATARWQGVRGAGATVERFVAMSCRRFGACRAQPCV